MGTSTVGTDPRIPGPPALTLDEARMYADFARRESASAMNTANALRHSLDVEIVDEARRLERAAFSCARAAIAAGVALDAVARLNVVAPLIDIPPPIRLDWRGRLARWILR